jgi:hypothetical protein
MPAKRQTLLDELSDLREELELEDMEQQEAIEKILTPEIKEQLEQAEKKYAEKIAVRKEKAKDLESSIRANILVLGESVKGETLHAIFVKGRTSWDSKKLDGMMVLLPELNECRKVGSPSVSLRKIG